MMPTTEEITLKFHACRGMVEKLINNHVNRVDRGADADEVRGEAYRIFVTACHRYETKCREGTPPCQFNTWAYNQVKWGLIALLKQKKRASRVRVTSVGDEAYYVVDRYFELELCLLETSDDARAVMEMALQPPADVCAAMHRRASDRPQELRQEISRYLSARGWGPSRIKRAYAEAAEAIHGYRAA